MAKNTNKKSGKKSFDMYEEVTKRVIEQLEAGYIPWLKPWTGGNGAWSRATGKNYAFINQMLLPEGEYITFKELKEEGGELIKDEDGKTPAPHQVWSFWYKVVEKEEEDPNTGDTTTRRVFLPKAKYQNVWNVKEDTTLEVKYNKDPDTCIDPIAELEAIKKDYIKRSGVRYKECLSSKAYYSPLGDNVVVPCRKQFEKPAEFYNTVFHELAHSTGAPSRLNRFKIFDADAAFGSETYSREELVAELTACSVIANMGAETNTSFRNNAAYIQSWLNALKNDTKMLIRASAKAEAAYKLIMNIKDEEETEDAE